MKRELYRMAKRPAFVPVKRRDDFPKIEAKPAPELITVDRATECHVTPPDVAARMASYLGNLGSGLALEPSAGTGNLSRALINGGQPASRIVQVERHIGLARGLHDLGSVVNKCFLEYAAAFCPGTFQFSFVLMNPPFSDVRKHIKAARCLLGRYGQQGPAVLVALVPITFETDGMETLEHLPDDTFSTAKVRTKIIRIYGA